MGSTDSFVTLIAALLLFTSFVKIATALTIFRYGVGLTGFEFGVVCLLVSFAFAVVAAPPELRSIGFPQAIFSADQSRPPTEEVTKALLPFMAQRVDPTIKEALAGARESIGTAGDTGGTKEGDELSMIAPAFLLSELRSALSIGCLLLIPFIVIDLLVAHLMTLLGITHLTTSVVSLPLKLVLFLAVDGWTLLARKLLGM